MKLLNQVENYKSFLTVEEINKRLKQLSPKTIFEIGKSNEGNKIFCCKLGNGNENALIFGFPHPNEPVGSLTCLSLIKLIKNNKKLQERFTWYIIPVSDPDGAKLNEGWFKGKFTIKKYAFNYYRGAPNLQSDWSFPVKYKKYKFTNSPKQNKALKKLIDKIKPKIDYPLHNAGFGGAYFLISKKMPKKSYHEIISLCNKLKIPLDMGAEENPFMKELKKPIYMVPFFEEFYDFLEKNGEISSIQGGQASIDYVKKINPTSFGIVGEIPYIYDKKISDKKRTSQIKRDVFRKGYQSKLESLNFISDFLKLKEINKKSLFYIMLDSLISLIKSEVLAALNNLSNKKYLRKATIAEVFSSEVITKFGIVLLLGSFRRLLLESKKTEKTKELLKQTEEKINYLINFIDSKSKYKVISIRNLVQLQVGCLLIFMKYLK